MMPFGVFLSVTAMDDSKGHQDVTVGLYEADNPITVVNKTSGDTNVTNLTLVKVSPALRLLTVRIAISICPLEAKECLVLCSCNFCIDIQLTAISCYHHWGITFCLLRPLKMVHFDKSNSSFLI